MKILPEFEPIIRYLDLDAMEQSADVIYIIDTEFRLCMYNTAWEEFALLNNGARVLETYQIGSRVNSAYGVTKAFYEEAYLRSLKTNTPFDQDYECSSGTVYRIFHQTAYPLVNRSGLLISNHLIVEKPHPGTPSNFSDNHINSHGDIIQCAHCRKIKDNLHPNKWDWIPALVEHPSPNISHTFCPLCLEFYYPDGDD